MTTDQVTPDQWVEAVQMRASVQATILGSLHQKFVRSPESFLRPPVRIEQLKDPESGDYLPYFHLILPDGIRLKVEVSIDGVETPVGTMTIEKSPS